jgi:hypothetical protein
MKTFTDNDLQPWAGSYGLFADRSELVDAPLWWQSKGLQQTATGYGSKLTMTQKINFNGKLYRLYCTCYGNAGSVWFIAKGKKIYVN